MILECIDSEDITIRVKALDLVQGMVSSDNLVSIVSRLMRQLKSSSASSSNPRNGTSQNDVDDTEEEGQGRRSRSSRSPQAPPALPEDYITDVIGRILSMCSQSNYSHLVDFEWYIDVLRQLVRLAPVPRGSDQESESASGVRSTLDISERIGDEIRNVAVKVRAIRYAAVAAAEAILSQATSESPSTHVISSGVVKPAAFVVGEFCSQLADPDDALSYLLHLLSRMKNPETLATCLQAAIKILAHIAGDEQAVWTSERKSRVSLLMARVIHALEPLTMHPYLEVQERAVEFSELLKLTAEAVSGQTPASDEQHQDAPLLLTQAIPSLFSGWELNSVAVGAQKHVPIPDDLDLDEPIHPNLGSLLATADHLEIPAGKEDDEFEAYYNEKPAPTSISSEPAINRLTEPEEAGATSYQQAGEESYLDADILAQRKAERRERNKDDPFYIGDLNASKSEGTSTPIHHILQTSNGPDLDIDSIPIMQLDLEKLHVGLNDPSKEQQPSSRPRARQKVMIAQDETIPSGSHTPRSYDSENNSDSHAARARSRKLKASLLQVDSSVIGDLSLEAAASGADKPFDYERHQQEEKEMALAVKEVERLRLEMLRANERIQVAKGVPDEGTVLKKKKKKVVKKEGEGDGAEPKKKKKKKAVAIIDESGHVEGVKGEDAAGEEKGEVVVAKPKKKKKRVVKLDGDEEEASQA